MPLSNSSPHLLLSTIARKYQSKSDLTKFATDPIGFAHQVLGIKLLTSDQQRILLSIRDNRETNVPSAHGMGKTKTGAIASLWWVFAVKGLAITTAPTERQVKELLWSEIRSMYDANQHKLGGERGQLFVKLNENSRAFGFAAQDYNLNSFQGVHHQRLLVIQDEACGISPAIDEGSDGCVTGAENRILRIGNPIVPGTPFEAACKRMYEKYRM